MELRPTRGDMVPAGQPREVNAGTAQTNRWSDRKKWIMGLASSIVVSAIVAWLTALTTTQAIRKSEIKEGQAVFNTIGLRYFDALFGAYDKKTGEPSNNPTDWKTYRDALDGLQKDIQWLRTNPFYGRLPKSSQNYLGFAQNRLIGEIVKEGPTAGSSALYFMCKVFVKPSEPGEWKLEMPKDEVTKVAYDFAALNCKSVLSSETAE